MSPESVIELPLGFHEWSSLAQAVSLGLLTFVQEDAPTIGAALLSSGGALNPATAFIGCAFGIWVGDALLYLVARFLGRRLIERSWARRFVNETALLQSEQWFAQHGLWLLLGSRVLPGARLPTYVAAGFLRIAFGKFLAVTGIAVLFWTAAIFLLARVFGTQLITVIDRWSHGGLIFSVLAFVVGLRLLLRTATVQGRRRLKATIGRWMHWEFWPAWLFYAPVVVNYLWLALRFRGITLPTAANPGIFTGGLVGESKIATLRELFETSPDVTAEAYLLEGDPDQRLDRLQELLAAGSISYPFILKPDVGQRGVGVKLIRSMKQATDYLNSTPVPLLCQKYAAGPHEVGIFYYRLPHQPRGKIFAITEKVFPEIFGDGVHTVEELIWADPRARFMAAKYLARHAVRRHEVLGKDSVLKLVEAGNHAQGCIFRDGTHLWSQELEWRIDEISRRLKGFYIGRHDIRYTTTSDLRAGNSFQIIELNGAASEATSIYDSRNSLWAAYRTLFRQWHLVFAIGAANRKRGLSPIGVIPLWRAWRSMLATTASCPSAD